MLATSSAGWAAIGVIGFIILIALAFWPARVARRKGHSWILFFIFSLFLFIPALIVAYLMPNRRRRERREKRREDRRDLV
jgi:ABC-type Mn2+/Zn2+ transport system permease subunit